MTKNIIARNFTRFLSKFLLLSSNMGDYSGTVTHPAHGNHHKGTVGKHGMMPLKPSHDGHGMRPLRPSHPSHHEHHDHHEHRDHHEHERRRHEHEHRGSCGGGAEPACAFNKPPPHRCYCQPSAFQATDGRDYHMLAGGAYGKSVPCGDMM